MENCHSTDGKTHRGWYARLDGKDSLTIVGTGQITIHIDAFDPRRTKVFAVTPGLFDEDMGPLLKKIRYPLRKGLALEVNLYKTDGNGDSGEHAGAELVVGPLSMKLPADEAGMLVAALQGFPPVPRQSVA